MKEKTLRQLFAEELKAVTAEQRKLRRKASELWKVIQILTPTRKRYTPRKKAK